MRARMLVITATLGMATLAWAQTIGPGGGPMAPGPSQPHGYTPGGTGPGGVSVAPGPAARGVNVERVGPGGSILAPGPAGSVRTGPTFRRPTVVRTSRAIITQKAKRRQPAKKRKRRAP
jgi:hypothetical protein